MTKRAVLYARVSSDDRGKDGRNLAGQLAMGREYAQEHGYTVIAELAEDDRGASGAEIDLPQLTRVRDMARRGEFDVLVVRELDRLSRSLAKQLIIEQELKSAGVVIEYVAGEYPDTPEGRLNKHIKATIAEYEREKIAERSTRGRRLKVKAGHVIVNGRPPYGYSVGEVDSKRMLVIREPEARVVRMIFDWYTVGDSESGPVSMYEIVKRLTAKGIPTRGDTDARTIKRSERGKWHRATVACILHRETYAGVWHYGKSNRSKPEDYLIAVKVPAIVSRETWQAAQERMKHNKANAKRNTRYNYLLRRRLTCGDCGIKMGCRMARPGKGRGKRLLFYYGCPARRNPDFVQKCPQKSSFRADQVDAAVWDWVKSFLTDPAVLAEGLQAEQEEREEANAPLRNRLAVVDDLLGDNRRQLERLLDLYLSGDFGKEMLTERKTRLETTISALERERAGLAAQVEAQTLTDEQVQTITELAEKVRQKLPSADQSFKARRDLIELLDVQATLTVEDGEKVAYARCLLGEDTLSIASTNSRIRTGRGRRRAPGRGCVLPPPPAGA
jgi:site-specific DNA recombinase